MYDWCQGITGYWNIPTGELINGEDDVYVVYGRWSGPQTVAKSEGHVSAGRGTNVLNLKSYDTE